MYLNRVQIMGNLTRDPELKALPSGMNVCNIAVATNRTYKDRDGKKAEETQYHDVVIFGRTAENVTSYLRKGSSIYVEGRLNTRSWEQNGEKKYRTEVIAETVQFGPKAAGSTPAADPLDAVMDEPKDNIDPDSIPF